MRPLKRSLLVLPLVATLTTPAAALDQFADSVVDFSSQYSASSWSAAQILGEPDTFSYGDIPTAWAPSPRNGTLEFITVSFAAPVVAEGVTIWETYGNGFVREVQVRDLLGGYHTVWADVDPSPEGAPVEFHIAFPPTGFQVDAVRILVDTDHNPATWEEIDAVMLHESFDRDGDGVPDEFDACPDSDTSETVVIDGLDSGVVNFLVTEDGCTLADLVHAAADEARNHGDFVSLVTRLANALRKADLLAALEARALKRAAAGSIRRAEERRSSGFRRG